MLEPSQGVLEPLGEHDTAVQTHAGCWGLQDWGCAVCVGAGGSALLGSRGQVGWQKLACFQPACVSQLWQVQVLKSKLAQKVAFA